MNFRIFKEFKGDSNVQDIFNYLRIDLPATLRELAAGLRFLSLEDNFGGFKEDVIIPPSSEVLIRNRLPLLPTGFVVTMKNEGGIYLCKGDTTWTLAHLSLKNVSPSLTAQATVVFLR